MYLQSAEMCWKLGTRGYAHRLFDEMSEKDAGTGIAELIALQISKQSKGTIEEARKRIWLIDSKGLVVNSRMESLQSFKKLRAHDHEPIDNLVDVIKAIKPAFLIGSSGRGEAFTKETIEAMSSINKKPVILSLSNPTPQSECTPEEDYKWSKGNAILPVGALSNRLNIMAARLLCLDM